MINKVEIFGTKLKLLSQEMFTWHDLWKPYHSAFKHYEHSNVWKLGSISKSKDQRLGQMKGIVIRYLNKVCTKYEICTLDSLGGQGHKVKKTLESIERYCHKNCLV